MQLGIVGLPNAGKSTLFNALTQAEVETEKYPFTTIEPNVGVVPVPDGRLEPMGDLLNVPDRVPATVRFVDIAGLVRGASKGEGLGNQFLAHIREVDAIVHVVRAFHDDTISHVEGDIAPLRDLELIRLELAMADLATVERRLAETRRRAKSGDERQLQELQSLERLHETLASGQPARTVTPQLEDNRWLLNDLQLLTSKQELVVVNTDEDHLEETPQDILDWAAASEAEVVMLAASLEAEIQHLPPEERQLFLSEYGLNESGLTRLIRSSYRLLDLITFYTANDEEVRARPVQQGTPVTAAAGRIHTDMQEGFIRADVLPVEKLLEAGSYAAARQAGCVRSEGRGYGVQDGDLIYIHFHAP